MVKLRFVLSPESCAKLHDVLVCLSKFSDAISVEAQSTQLTLTALNSSKSTFASCSLDATVFFLHYEYEPDYRQEQDQFAIQILNKALLHIFKGRLADPRSKETAVERCEVDVVDEPEQAVCRFLVKLVCVHGVVKKYSLTYEAFDMMHALFDKNRATNTWTIQARKLRDVTEHFDPKADQLSIYSDGEAVTLTSYTEKIMNGNEVLRQPLQTSVSIDYDGFDTVSVAERLQVVIGVRDFKSIIAHADTMRGSITAMYSQPMRPMQLSYGDSGMRCEFTLMTTGDDIAIASINPASTIEAAQIAAKTKSMQTDLRNSFRGAANSNIASRTSFGRSTQRSINNETQLFLDRQIQPVRVVGENPSNEQSLFVPQQEDESQWEPQNQHSDDEALMGWDASGIENSTSSFVLRDSFASRAFIMPRAAHVTQSFAITPTQRASQVRGLFDD